MIFDMKKNIVYIVIISFVLIAFCGCGEKKITVKGADGVVVCLVLSAMPSLAPSTASSKSPMLLARWLLTNLIYRNM